MATILQYRDAGPALFYEEFDCKKGFSEVVDLVLDLDELMFQGLRVGGLD
jgi:hypothetical protein